MSPIQKRFLNAEEAAAYLGVSKSWLYDQWRVGGGPPRCRIAGRIFVPIEELNAWMLEHQVVVSEASQAYEHAAS